MRKSELLTSIWHDTGLYCIIPVKASLNGAENLCTLAAHVSAAVLRGGLCRAASGVPDFFCEHAPANRRPCHSGATRYRYANNRTPAVGQPYFGNWAPCSEPDLRSCATGQCSRARYGHTGIAIPNPHDRRRHG